MTDQSTTDQINASIAAARAAASQTVAQLPGAANGNAIGATVQQLPTGGRPIGMREMVAETGAKPDHYLKVNSDAGFKIGKDAKSFFEEILVEFKLNAGRPFYGLRFGAFPNTTYLRSFDRQVESRSKTPWATKVAQAGSLDPTCTGDYPALDLNMVCVNELKAKDGSVLVKAGETIGWTSAITNWSEWVEFIEPYYHLMDAGILASDAKVRGTIKHDLREKGANSWGVLTFADDFSIVDEEAQVAKAA